LPANAGHGTGGPVLAIPAEHVKRLRRRLAEIPRTGRVILYCACPPLEVQAAYQFLRDQGYRNTSVMEDGFPGWVKLGYPVER